MRCVRMELGEPDASGRRRPVPVAGSEFEFETDMVVYRDRHQRQPDHRPDLEARSSTSADTSTTDENLATSMAGVYAGGDIVTGAATVIEAMGAGRKAARSMKAYLGIRDDAPARHASDNRCFGIDVRERNFARMCAQQSNARNRRASTPSRTLSCPPTSRSAGRRPSTTLTEHIVEVISDSGEGAQRCGQSLGAIAARMGNGIWTVEIIPAEIQPPARSVAGASGNRIRIGSARVTNGGDEDRPRRRVQRAGAARPRARRRAQAGLHHPAREHVARARRSEDCVGVRRDTRQARGRGLSRHRSADGARVPRAQSRSAQRGKNMFVLGHAVQHLQLRPAARARPDRAHVRQEGPKRDRPATSGCSKPGYAWAEANLDFKYRIPAERVTEPQIVVNGNTALALGVLASGHGNLRDVSDHAGDFGVALPERRVRESRRRSCTRRKTRSRRARSPSAPRTPGKCAVTITSGPGYSLKQEAIGLAVMGEIPLVVVNVQRGGPSTGQPTKVEQGDLLAAIFGSHGDAPKVVMAPSHDRGLLLLDDHRAQDRRDASTWSSSCCPTRASPRRSSRSRDRSSTRRGSRRRSTRAPVPEGAKPYDWDVDDRPRAPLRSRPAAAACTR